MSAIKLHFEYHNIFSVVNIFLLYNFKLKIEWKLILNRTGKVFIATVLGEKTI